MPYKFEYTHLQIPEEKDRRIKLSDSERQEIKEMYGKISQRKLAKLFGVSRRLVIFIGCPEKYKLNLQQRKERGGSMIYYDTEKSRKSMKEHRDYKKELYLRGELIE